MGAALSFNCHPTYRWADTYLKSSRVLAGKSVLLLLTCFLGTSSDMNKRTEDANPAKTKPKYSTAPTGCRGLWACAFRSLGDATRSRRKSRSAVSGEFWCPATSRQKWSCLRKLCSREGAAWAATRDTWPEARGCPQPGSGLSATAAPHTPCPALFHGPNNTSCFSSPVSASAPLLVLFWNVLLFHLFASPVHIHSLCSFKMSQSP